MESWTVICGSRRDQEEGGGAGPSLRVGQSFASPGEIKGDDAGPSRKPRRDQEEGGGAGPSLRVGQSLASVVPQQLLLRSCDFALHSC